jgi:hypothetical protein
MPYVDTDELTVAKSDESEIIVCGGRDENGKWSFRKDMTLDALEAVVRHLSHGHDMAEGEEVVIYLHLGDTTFGLATWKASAEEIEDLEEETDADTE